jgi:hypothetical protein
MLLIVSHSEKDGAAISQIFHFMGIVNLSLTPAKSFSAISNVYHAILISNPQALADEEEFVHVMRHASLGAAVFAISDNASYAGLRRSGLYDEVFCESAFSSLMYSRINEAITARSGKPIGEYRLCGIDASCELNGVYYFGKKIKLTKTETMILRYLIATYPAKQETRNILTHAFRHGRTPEPSNVRTHISSINKKFREAFGKNIIFSSEFGGYSILTPELSLV